MRQLTDRTVDGSRAPSLALFRPIEAIVRDPLLDPDGAAAGINEYLMKQAGSPVRQEPLVFACQEALRTSLRAAVDRVLAAQGVSSVSELTYDKHIDDIRATTAGVVGVRPIDWQNRPTFQQVVSFEGHRQR